MTGICHKPDRSVYFVFFFKWGQISNLCVSAFGVLLMKSDCAAAAAAFCKWRPRQLFLGEGNALLYTLCTNPFHHFWTVFHMLTSPIWECACICRRASVSSERAFSVSGGFVTEKRTSLKDSTINALCFLKGYFDDKPCWIIWPRSLRIHFLGFIDFYRLSIFYRFFFGNLSKNR